jgi:hypothetical protein
MTEKDVQELAEAFGTMVEKILKVVIPKDDNRSNNDKSTK